MEWCIMFPYILCCCYFLGITDVTGKQIIFNEVISKIRFLNMSPQEFAEGPVMSSFISKDDSLALLINITSTNSPICYPKNFSNKLRGKFEENKLNKNCIQENLILKLNIGSAIVISKDTDYAFSICCDKDIKIHGFMVSPSFLIKIIK